jgi:hypothetical protein
MTGLNGRRPTSGRRAPNVIWPQIARSARPGTSQREDFQHARVASPPLLLNRAYRKPAAGRSQHAIARGRAPSAPIGSTSELTRLLAP